MNINKAEGLQSSHHHKIEKALKILGMAFRAPLFFMLGCGYVTAKSNVTGATLEYHDHGNKEIVRDIFIKVKYNPKKHGEITNFVQEGEIVPGQPT